MVSSVLNGFRSSNVKNILFCDEHGMKNMVKDCWLSTPKHRTTEQIQQLYYCINEQSALSDILSTNIFNFIQIH